MPNAKMLKGMAFVYGLLNCWSWKCRKFPKEASSLPIYDKTIYKYFQRGAKECQCSVSARYF